MTDVDHKQLAELLRSLKGMVIVSSYPCALYDRLFRGWRKVEWSGGQFCSDNRGGRLRTEAVWLNKATVRNQRQIQLF
jgi:DNA adenine methylase